VLQYVTIVVSFAAVVIGVFGGKWDDKRRRITAVGWIAISLGAISALAATWQTHRDNVAALAKSREISSIHDLARADIARALDELTEPIHGIWIEYKGGQPHSFPVLLTHQDFLDACDSLSPIDHIAFGNKLRWCDYISDCAKHAKDHLESTQQKYSSYLSSAEVAAIEDLVNDAFVARMISLRHAIDEVYGPTYHHSLASALFHGFSDPDGDYLPFVRKLLRTGELVGARAYEKP
jgi:hypothetical protein